MKKRRISVSVVLIIFAVVLIFLNQPQANSEKTPNKPASQAGSSQSGSIATAYRSLQELTTSADLIAEVEITGTRDKKPGSHFLGYTAMATDLIEEHANPQEIVIVGASPPQVQEGVWSEDRVSFEIGAKHILFLKKGKDSSNDSLYYISGVHQGRFDIEKGTVKTMDAGYGTVLAEAADQSSASAAAANESYVPDESLTHFKAKIRRLQASLN